MATRIPFEGRFGDSKVGLFATIANLFRHGFIRHRRIRSASRENEKDQENENDEIVAA
ncbi:MAG: hypothetical protein Q7S40_15085 [Opitutaceae bacterium]|nr:hypothetical protein [Opitutaceae bacterium]